LVTVVAVRGSVPRHVGSKMAVLPDGTIVGTVGGGLLEARAIERAKGCIAAGRSESLEVELTGAETLGATPVCGGVANLWIEYVADTSPFKAALSRLDEGRTVVLASLRGGAGPGGAGDARPGPECAAVLDSEGALVEGRQHCADAADAAKAAASGIAVLNDAADHFYDPILPPERLLVLGGGHVGRAVAGLAVGLDFKVTIADDRPGFSDPGRFPANVETLNGRYLDLIDRFPFGPSTYALIVTPGHLSDLDCTRAVLRKNYRYLGLIGSRRKVRMIMKQLVSEGHDRGRVEALHSPVGVDIGAETPEEIAVSILAEMIAVRHNSPALAAMELDRKRRRG
ncbi:MAG: XdhC family protein, partial [Spirochaetes bacterium]|nr:XdhC family protein [Spirochaetota bacterium]